MTRRRRHSHDPPAWRVPARAKPAMISVVVLIVIALLSLAGFAFVEVMLGEHLAARAMTDRAAARATVDSAVELLAMAIEQPPQERADDFGSLVDNAEHLQAQPLPGADDDPRACRFTVLTPLAEEPGAGPVRFGLEDESTRLNLLAVLRWDQSQPGTGRTSLMALPGMTLEVADAILDWMDADDTPREFGAESEYYSSLEPAYLPAQSPPAALEELLLVRGVSRRMLLGLDRNRNLRIDPDEVPEEDSYSTDSGSQSLPPGGWSTWLTLASAERVAGPAGEPPIDLNQPDLALLHEQLTATYDRNFASFAVAYRQFGPAPPATTGGPAGPSTASWNGASAELPAPNFQRRAAFSLRTVYDLYDVSVLVPSSGAGTAPQVLRSPWGADRDYFRAPERLEQLARLGCGPGAVIVGRVNLWLAPAEVLGAIPGWSPSLVDEILAKRPAQFDPLAAEAPPLSWLVENDLLDAAQLRQAAAFLTRGGQVFRAQVISKTPGGSPLRAAIVLDATRRPVRLLDYEALTAVGPGWTDQVLWGASAQPVLSTR